MDFFSGPVYLPTPIEGLILLLVVIELFVVGRFVKGYWANRNENVPFTVALIMWIGMVAAYCGVTYLFYNNATVGHIADPNLIVSGPGGLERFASDSPVADRRPTMFFWCVVFGISPMFYYVNMLRESFAANTVEHIGPMSSMHIEDPSQFAAARKLALRGDVDAAVARYMAYNDNKADAIFEAARLLKSEDRYPAAAALFERIMAEFTTDKAVWAEAIYQLAKLKEVALGQPEEAKDCLRRLLQRAPETRFGEMASADLSRLQALGEGFSRRADKRAAARADNDEADAPEDKAPRGIPSVQTDENYPDLDPFYLAALERQRVEKARRGALGTSTSVRVTTDMGSGGTPEPVSGNGKSAAKPRAKAKPKAKAKATAKAPPKAKATAKAPAAKKSSAAKVSAKKPAAKKKAAAKKPAAQKKPKA